SQVQQQFSPTPCPGTPPAGQRCCSRHSPSPLLPAVHPLFPFHSLPAPSLLLPSLLPRPSLLPPPPPPRPPTPPPSAPLVLPHPLPCIPLALPDSSHPKARTLLPPS